MKKNFIMLVIAVVFVAAGGFMQDASAQTQQICGTAELYVMQKRYVVDPNPWNITDPALKNNICQKVGPSNHFVVTHTYDISKKVSAYPNVQFGCGPHTGELCTKGLPVKLSYLMKNQNPKVSFSTSRSKVGSKAKFNTSIDMRFGDQHHTKNTAELMIWLNEPNVQQTTPYINKTINGVAYHIVYRQSESEGIYVQFRRVHATDKVQNLPLKPFIAYAMQNFPGNMQPSTKFWSLQAGFELWQGGKGLTENGFSVTGMGN